MPPLRSGLLAAALAAAGCAAPGPDQQRAAVIAAQPNVVVILADDLGYADISTYGVKRISTPNIDRIARSGVAFTDGYSAAPVCSPSRAGLNTGRHPDRFGFEFNNGPAQRDIEQNLGIPKDEVILAKALKGQGYHTGLIGKWHLGSNDDFYPTNRGYDEFVGFLTGATSYINPKAPGVIVSKPEGSEATPPARRTPPNRIVEGPGRREVDNEDRYLTEYLGERAVEYVRRNAASAAPYFLFAAFNAPHDPLMTTQKYYDRFPQIKDEGMRVYASMISALDDQVGAIIDAVEASGENSNTIIYFMSDNGCAAYIKGICDCQPLRGGKLSHYEGGTRVPFMMRWPGHVEGGKVYRNVVSTMDVFTTSLTAAGGSLPNDRVFDGVDLMPYLSGKDPGIPHDQLAWRRSPNASIRKGDWKMWKDLNGKFTYLFNLKDDPNESSNLADKEPGKLKELTDAFDQWARDMKDPAWPSRPFVNYNVCGTPFELPI